jgi:transcriptional regulator GlxA family with amidase domain
MNRRELLQKTAALSILGAIPASRAVSAEAFYEDVPSRNQPAVPVASLKPPASGSIPVAFAISDGAVVIDFAGPWEVFGAVNVPSRSDNPFRLYTVAANSNPIQASGGLKIVPDYTFKNAPAPKVIVIPAQNGADTSMLNWIRESSRNTDVTMSVCTGAYVLAKTGLLSGKSATTHHGAYKEFAYEFPDIHVKRGARYVEEGNLATAGGLSSGIDLALHVVDRYYGREVATKTATMMEYQGRGWLNPDSNQEFAKSPVSTPEHPLCVVCEMEVNPKTSPTSVYHAKTYYFCMPDHKAMFDAAPQKFLEDGD